jgi:hypothetical protein
MPRYNTENVLIKSDNHAGENLRAQRDQGVKYRLILGTVSRDG